MTIIWTADLKHRHLPTVGYLESASRRSDADGLNRPHVDAVLRARRDRDNHAHRSGEPVLGGHPRVAGDAAPGLPAASFVERAADHPWRWVASFAACFVLACASLFAPMGWQIAIGAVLGVAGGVACMAAVRK